MKTKIKSKKIIIELILIIASVLAIATISQAVTYDKVSSLLKDGYKAVGKTIGTIGKLGNNDINLEGEKHSQNLYCIQKYNPLGEKNNYEVKHYVEIEGNVAKIYNSSSDNYKTVTNSSNAILAYILGGGDYDKGFGKSDPGTARQQALWAYWNTWAGNKDIEKALGGKNYIWSDNSGSYNSVYEEAKNYSKNVTTANIKLTNSTSTIESKGTYDGYELVGPIKLSYQGTLASVTAKSDADKEISSSNLEFYSKDSKKINFKDIKSGQEFYIKNKSGEQIKNINFKVTANGAIKAKIWILENGNNATQRLIITDTSKENTEADVTIKIQRIPEGDIELIKKDASTGNPLKGAEFKIYDFIKGGYLYVNALGTYDYTTSYDQAKTFITGDNGKLTIKNIPGPSKLEVYETKAPEGYKLEDQEHYGTYRGKQMVKCGGKTYTIANGTKIEITMENSKTGDIKIIKEDTDTKEVLKGAEFKISRGVEGNKTKNTWLKKNSDGKYTYTSNFEEATSFGTDDKGIAEIKELEPDTYYIYEVTAPKGYNIEVQKNYDSTNKWVRCGSNKVDSGKVTQVQLNNDHLISIEGYVWVDVPQTKANSYNDLPDTSEEIITDKVTITLRNKADGSIVLDNPTISNGKYRFDKIVYSKLKDYYVQFDYTKDYKDYITVAANFDLAEGSKALSDNVPDYDKDLVGMATTYKGSKDEAKYGLSGLTAKFYNESTYTLENINLGIKQLPATDYAISENPAYVDMSIKGYNYRYIYGGTGEKIQTVPTIKWQGKTDKEAYTRAVYPSDIEYTNPEDHTQELDIHITYRIDITNNTMTDIPYLYQEKYLNVKSLTNKFDTDIYTLEDGNWGMTTNESGELVAKIKDSYLQECYYEDYSKGNGISNEDGKNNKYAYITFRLKPDAIKRILRPEGLIEAFPVTATVTAYHKYTRIDYSWKNALTQTQTHYTNEETRSDAAYYFGWEPGENRTISGTVFEDKDSKTEDSEVLGNGLYDEKENKVKDVIVELGNYNKDGEFVVTNIYPADEKKNIILDESGNYLTAKQTTSEKGTYSFEGIVPGEYYIRFTYGDGTQKICDLNGNEIKDVYSNEYKSTIVTSEIKTAFETKYKDTQARWYLGISDNHNTAVDDLAGRSGTSITATSASLKVKDSTLINAYTPIISIPIEYKIDTVGLSTDEYPSELGYMNFGIITIPETRIDIEKKITNIKLTLQNGQTLTEGNPAIQSVPYVADLDKNTEGGSTYVKIELDSEYIYGSKLEITYDITVTNNSDLDYIENEDSAHYGYYYKYGIITDGAKERTVTIDQLYDYLDPKLSYDKDEQKGTQIITAKNVSEIESKEESDRTPEETEVLNLVKNVEEITGLDYKEILEITNLKDELYSSKGENKDKSSTAVTINANRILTTGDDDLEFINIAEVTKITVPKLTTPNIEGAQIAMSKKVIATVTPSTGGDRSILYFTIGAIALITIAGGIFLIKKKVLK